MVGEFHSNNILNIDFLFKTFSNYYVLAGIALYAINSVLWLMVISKLPISKAYPAISLSYVIVIIGAYFFVGEPLTIKKIIGSMAILGGVSIIFMK